MLREAKAKCLLCVGDRAPQHEGLHYTILVHPCQGLIVENIEDFNPEAISLPEVWPEDAWHHRHPQGSARRPQRISPLPQLAAADLWRWPQRPQRAIDRPFFRCGSAGYFPALNQWGDAMLAGSGNGSECRSHFAEGWRESGFPCCTPFQPLRSQNLRACRWAYLSFACACASMPANRLRTTLCVNGAGLSHKQVKSSTFTGQQKQRRRCASAGTEGIFYRECSRWASR